MEIYRNMIIEFNKDSEIERKVLEAFCSEDDNLLFSISECDLEYQFKLNRVITESKEWIFDWLPTQDPRIKWFGPRDREELKLIIENIFPPYICIVLPKKELRITSYKYILYANEHTEYQGRECTALHIMKEREKDSFKKEIIGKLIYH